MLGVINNGVDDLKETELRLGLPGANPNIEAAAAVKNNNGKRGFSETVDLKLNLASKASSVVGSSTTTTTDDDDESDHMLKKDHKINSSVVSSSTDPANPPPKAQVVGWPPVRSFRKNSLAVQKNNSSKEAAAFVKVSVDGAPYLRKVDLKAFNSYKQLSQALTNMFSSSSTIEYVPTYEDKDGDWMLVGDVPWEMFVDSCKRLRMMKGSEAIGVLVPRAVEKCKNRS